MGQVNSKLSGLSKNPIDEVGYLAGEMKLLAINLAIALAKLQGRHKALSQMERRFTDLIKKANDTSLQVTEVLDLFKSSQRMKAGLPASSEIIEMRGAYDGLEAKLNHVYELSQSVFQTLDSIKRQEKAG